ncbi:thioredoxin family protein [Pacificimonas sp. WHA3]|uniref:Thioredoxin family protein n=2 Tax=Pacificimonas pallii TaxID=2827236 RepID=A0ABS6SEE9_9SPHN|nr:thioredoxin family protein [Pacificimonas pallii]
MSVMHLSKILMTLLALLIVLPASAQLVQNPYARIELKAGPAEAGARTVAIVMTPMAGWHTYWKNPGAAGVETRAQWELPRGASAADIQYPVPSRFLVSGIMNYVFEGESALLVDMAGLPQTGPHRAALTLDYLVCDDSICVPESAALSADLRDIETSDRQIAEYRSALPARDGWTGQFAIESDVLRAAISMPGAARVTDAYFFPLIDGALDYNAPQAVSVAGGKLVLETAAGYDPGVTEIPGVLKLFMGGDAVGAELLLSAGDVPAMGAPLAAGAPPAESAGAPSPSLALAFGLALLGGLFLNVMPCVFPILSLKALSLAKGGASPAAARSEALFYTLGIVTTILALGGALLALRAGGASVGWAFQLQDPRVVAGLLLLVTAIALNLAGLYQLPGISLSGDGAAASGGKSGAFWTGALAAVVATPCTGPFMGAALGAALVLSGPAAMVIFLGLGLGLALPFLAIGFVPALRHRLPRPGPWMARLRKLLSLPMFATALGLIWVLGRQAGVDGLVIGVGAALLLGLALWWLGMSGRKILPMLTGAAAVIIAAMVPLKAQEGAAAAVTTAALPNSAAFSRAALQGLRDEGVPTFVYFTADWCITCKVNEKGALSDADVVQAFQDAGVRTLVGDWTRADPEITDYLASHGRAGVPLYLYFAAGDEARLLPQILSADMLIALTREPDTA